MKTSSMGLPERTAAATQAAKATADRPADGFKDRVRRLARAAIAPLAAGLVKIGLEPDHLTVVGMLFSVGAGLAFFEGGFRLGATLLLVSGLCDLLDGEMARRTGSTRFGAFLDSTLDRLADAAVLVGIAGFYLLHLLELVLSPQMAVAEIGRGLEPRTWAVVSLTAMLALVGSFMVSYTRARAEGLGLECRVGWFERPERMLLLIAAGFCGVGPWMPGALIVLTLLSFATAFQRVAYVRKQSRSAD